MLYVTDCLRKLLAWACSTCHNILLGLLLFATSPEGNITDFCITTGWATSDYRHYYCTDFVVTFHRLSLIHITGGTLYLIHLAPDKHFPPHLPESELIELQASHAFVPTSLPNLVDLHWVVWGLFPPYQVGKMTVLLQLACTTHHLVTRECPVSPCPSHLNMFHLC